MDKIRVSAVNFLNSKPFIYGLKHSPIIKDIDLQLDVPSVCADKLMSGQVDIGLVPVAVLPELAEYHILSDYCIGADGKVASVLLVGNCPVQQMEEVFLDHNSRTSIILAELIIKKSLKLNPVFSHNVPDIESLLHRNAKTGMVIIGDRALKYRNEFSYVYDLAEEWRKYTLLPFVFAQWVSNKELPDEFAAQFNAALKSGLDNRATVIEQEKKNYPGIDIEDYLMDKISYNFDNRKQTGLDLFLSYVEEHLEKDVMKII
jgi:chorismate dehydratase